MPVSRNGDFQILDYTGLFEVTPRVNKLVTSMGFHAQYFGSTTVAQIERVVETTDSIVAIVEIGSGKPMKAADYPAAIAATFGAKNAEEIIRHYPLSAYPSASVALAAAETDGGFSCPMREMIQDVARYEDQILMHMNLWMKLRLLICSRFHSLMGLRIHRRSNICSRSIMVQRGLHIPQCRTNTFI